MADIRTYTLIYIALVALATGKYVFLTFEGLFPFAVGLAATAILAIAKVGLIAGYYQHLIEEPRVISYMMATAVFMVLLLAIAAGYSIQ